MNVASQIEKDSTGQLRAGNLRPEIIGIIAGQNYRDMTTEETRAHVAWLKESIRQEGVKDPIDVIYADGKWYLAPGGGECRLTAAKELRKEKWDGYIPCFQVKGDEVYLLKRSILRNTGLAPTLLELGKALQQLIDLGQPLDEVVKCVPPSITTDPKKAIKVANKALDLNAAPVEVKKAVKEGIGGVKVSEARAVSETRKNSLLAAQSLATAASKAKSEGKTVLKREKGPGKATKAKAAERNTVEQCLALADALAAVVLDQDLEREEAVLCAKKYVAARGR
jgi:hypothetical protein